MKFQWPAGWSTETARAARTKIGAQQMTHPQSVTQTEVALPDDVTLMSMTDLQGRITYVNESFIRYSGYTREELLGQPL